MKLVLVVGAGIHTQDCMAPWWGGDLSLRTQGSGCGASPARESMAEINFVDGTEVREAIDAKQQRVGRVMGLATHGSWRPLGLVCGYSFPSPVCFSIITCQPNWPCASSSLPYDLLPVLNEQLIKWEGEINWPESCLVWLSSPLFSLVTIRTLGVCFTLNPPIHC